MADEFMEQVIEYCQEAIDGGYSKTKNLCFMWDANTGVTEYRADTHAKALRAGLEGSPRATRAALCVQRKQEDAMYVVSIHLVLYGAPVSQDLRVYPVPLNSDLWLTAEEVSLVDPIVPERRHR